MDPNVFEAVRYSSLWFAKEPTRAMESKKFWVLIEMDLLTLVSQWPRLSTNFLDDYREVVDFKANFHRVYIRAQKDPVEIWYPKPDISQVTKNSSLYFLAPHSGGKKTKYPGTSGKDTTIDKETKKETTKETKKDDEATEGIEQEQCDQDPLTDIEPVDSPFIMKRRIPPTSSAKTKHMSNRSKGMELMVLTEGDIDEIGDKVLHITEDVWGKIEDQYKDLLKEV